MKNLLIVMLLLFTISCQEVDKKKEAIATKEGIREQIGLLPIDNKLALDSSFKFLPLHPDLLLVDKKLAENENPSEFYVIDYYTDIKKDLNKKVIYKSQKGKLEVVKEEDKYKGERNMLAQPFLIFT